MGDWVVKLVLAIVPLMLAGAVTLAWQNNNALTELRLRVLHVEQELDYLRDHHGEK